MALRPTFEPKRVNESHGKKRYKCVYFPQFWPFLCCMIYLGMLRGHWESYKCVKVMLNPVMKKFCEWTTVTVVYPNLVRSGKVQNKEVPLAS